MLGFRDNQGRIFKTKGESAYPPKLCEALAKCYLRHRQILEEALPMLVRTELPEVKTMLAQA